MASGDIKGIDLDGAASENKDLFGTKISSAFLPPECVGPDPDKVGAYLVKSAKNKASGLRWEEFGLEKPKSGSQIKNTGLASALQQNKLKFTPQEWSEFGVSNLHYDSYFLAGNKYFRPERDKVLLPPLSLPSYLPTFLLPSLPPSLLPSCTCYFSNAMCNLLSLTPDSFSICFSCSGRLSKRVAPSTFGSLARYSIVP